jgi:hypothetical protein
VNAYFVHKDIAAESELAVEPELVPEGAIGEDKEERVRCRLA